jgi:hypothetical protein
LRRHSISRGRHAGSDLADRPGDDPIDGAPLPHHAEIDNRIAQSCGSGRSDEKDSRHQLVLDSLAHTLDRIDWCGQAVLLLMIKAAYSHSAVY